MKTDLRTERGLDEKVLAKDGKCARPSSRAPQQCCSQIPQVCRSLIADTASKIVNQQIALSELTKLLEELVLSGYRTALEAVESSR